MSQEPLEFLFGRLSTTEGRLAEVQSHTRGFFDLSDLQPLDPRPGEPLVLRFRSGTDVGLESIEVHYTLDGTFPLWDAQGPRKGTLVAKAQKASLLFDGVDWGYAQDWEVVLAPAPEGTLLSYTAIGFDASGNQVPCPFPGRDRHGSPRIGVVGVDQLTPPDWFRQAVIYHVFVDRFSPGRDRSWNPGAGLHERMGGTLWGLIEGLDHISQLGFNTLWLSPIFASPDYHGYATSNFFEVEPQLGGDAAWNELVAQAQARGLKIVLDFVANHLSDRHPAFLSAISSADRPEASWFRFRSWPSEYSCFFNVPSQPEVNAENPQVRDHLIEVAAHWLNRGVDGFRLDYAHGLSHGFWSRFRLETRNCQAESVCFGEITETPEVLRTYQGRLDGCLDFTLCDLLRKTFAMQTVSIDAFDRMVRRHLAFFPQSMVMPTFLDNHDMNRFLWLARGDLSKLRMAALIQFLLPGPPIVYYGTEIGLSQDREVGRLEEARLPMPESQGWNRDLIAYYRNLTDLRQKVRPWDTIWEPVRVEGREGWALYRVGEGHLLVNTRRTLRWDAAPGRLAVSSKLEGVRMGGGEGLVIAPWSATYWVGCAENPAKLPRTPD